VSRTVAWLAVVVVVGAAIGACIGFATGYLNPSPSTSDRAVVAKAWCSLRVGEPVADAIDSMPIWPAYVGAWGLDWTAALPITNTAIYFPPGTEVAYWSAPGAELFASSAADHVNALVAVPTDARVFSNKVLGCPVDRSLR